MNEERIFALMMDALDGVLDDRDSAELNTYLTTHPSMKQEWEAMQTVDVLLRAAPPVATPIQFSERTLARLPNPRARRIFSALFFVLLLLGGLIPIALGLLTFSQGGFGDIAVNLGSGFQIIRVLVIGFTSSLRGIVVTQPVVYGWLAAMLLAIGMWMNVYRNATMQLQPVLVRA